jgi:hypothetical protein
MSFFFLIALLSQPATSSVKPEVADWRLPLQTEIAEALDWRKDNPQSYLRAAGDFDGDGRSDTAELVVSEQHNAVAIRVRLSSLPSEPLVIAEDEGSHTVVGLGIDLVGPGDYKTACGKGYFECGPSDPEVLHLSCNAIDFFRFESANSFLIWQPEAKEFMRIWMSD